MQCKLGAVLVTATLMAGYASSPPPSQTGFLGDYSQLKPAPDREGVMLYLDRSTDLRPYTKLMFDPVQVLATPGPDVLRVRSAITHIQPARPEAAAIDYLPIKAVYNVGREAAGAGPRVAEMQAELEVLDPSGKRVVAATVTRKGDQQLPQGDRITWESLPPITDYWAKNFRARLDQLRGVARPAPAASQGRP